MKKYWVKTISLFMAMLMLVSISAFFTGCSNDGGEETSAADSSDNVSEIPETTEPSDTSNAPILVADFEKYALIRPQKVGDDLLDKINNLHQKLDSIADVDYKDDFYREDVPMYQIGEYEILVGKTNRPETIDFLSKLKYNDYGYAQYGKKIVIAGHSEDATIYAISQFIKEVVLPNERPDGVFYSHELDFMKTFNYDIASLFIGTTEIASYRLVYPKKNQTSEKVAAQLIADAIAISSGVVIDVVSDSEEPIEHEILVGATNRNTDAEIKEMSDKLGPTEAVIKYDGKKVTIFGATSTAMLVAANEFKSNFENVKSDKLEVTVAPEHICKYDDSILKAMSFNVWVSGKTVERNERVLTMVRNYFPDTIGFQEVDPVWLATLRDGLKDQYAYVGEGRNGGGKGEYNPIFYKKELFNLIDSGTKWLSETPDVAGSKYNESSLPRIYTYALLEKKTDGKRIMVVNTHFDHTSAEARELQAKVLVKYLKTITDYPIVLTGDFNCVESTSAYSTIISAGMQNSYKIADKKINNSATFTNYGSSNKIIDFVFVSPASVAVTSYKVCDEMINNDFPSDHHPVLIEYTILN
ncbi:MAG: endonuclease/exonuclease/phosphatase family protein [Clostridia bacterium]|nr:endonuclease/exonuclease/phosphatase family protein [Clostridia bacterium]